MPDWIKGRKWPHGGTPIATLPERDRMTKGQSFGPRIELVVGRDGYSGGISLKAYILDEAGEPAVRELFCHRWAQAPASIEECLEVAYRGIAAYMMEANIVVP
jgi:hypothetical protein